MAARTPRHAWDCVIWRSGTVVTPTSQQSAFPGSRLKGTMRAQTWRSAIGWTVHARNNKIDVNEGGVDRVATIASATYATGALFAAAVQTALNAMAGAVNTYTCTYDTSTKKFTIARATGAATVTLEWQSGTNAANSAGKDLGFLTTADDSGDTTYTGDKVSYQSRHWIDIDLGDATCDIDIVFGENDALDFVSSGVTEIAFLTPGHYSSPDALAAEAQARMNDVSGGNVVLWDPSTHLFSFDGSTTFSLLCLTGANHSRSAWGAFGFASVDRTGASTYSGTVPIYGWSLFQVAIVSDHNMAFQGLVNLVVNEVVPVTVALPGTDQVRLAFAGDVYSVQEYTLTIEDVQNVDGFNELRLFIGPYDQPSRGIDQGSEEGESPLDVVHLSDHGAVLGDDRPDAWTLAAQLSHLTEADKALLTVQQRTVGLVRPWWYIEDPLNDPRGTAHYVVLTQPFRFVRLSGVSPALRFATVLSLREDLP